MTARVMCLRISLRFNRQLLLVGVGFTDARHFVLLAGPVALEIRRVY